MILQVFFFFIPVTNKQWEGHGWLLYVNCCKLFLVRLRTSHFKCSSCYSLPLENLEKKKNNYYLISNYVRLHSTEFFKCRSKFKTFPQGFVIRRYAFSACRIQTSFSTPSSPSNYSVLKASSYWRCRAADSFALITSRQSVCWIISQRARSRATKHWTRFGQFWYEARSTRIMAASINLFSHAPASTFKMVDQGKNLTVMSLMCPHFDLTSTP